MARKANLNDSAALVLLHAGKIYNEPFPTFVALTALPKESCSYRMTQLNVSMASIKAIQYKGLPTVHS